VRLSVLVTGGAGFIGSHLVDRLLAAGDRVTVIDNFNSFYDPSIKRANISPHLDNPDFYLVEGDIRDHELVKETFRQGEFDTVFHLAAMAGVRPSLQNPLLYQDVNLNGTTNILEALREYGKARLVFASSSSVYGNNKKVPFSENDPVDHPISPYAATKKAGELLAYTYHHLCGISTVCLRFFTVYGPRQRPEMAIHHFTDCISNGREIKVFARGQSERDYTYIDDIIDGIMTCRSADFEYEIVNLGRSDSVKLSDLVKKLEALIGKKARIIEEDTQPGDVHRTIADVTKAEHLLGYSPTTDIDTGLRQFVRWYNDKRGQS
jgi:UDP-glucuronate 4-epimerase